MLGCLWSGWWEGEEVMGEERVRTGQVKFGG